MRQIVIALTLVVLMLSGAAQAKKGGGSSDSSQGAGKEIKKGMTLAEAEQLTGVYGTRVGGAREGHQIWRLSVPETSTSTGGRTTTVVYMLNVNISNGVIDAIKRDR